VVAFGNSSRVGSLYKLTTLIEYLTLSHMRNPPYPRRSGKKLVCRETDCCRGPAGVLESGVPSREVANASDNDHEPLEWFAEDALTSSTSALNSSFNPEWSRRWSSNALGLRRLRPWLLQTP
jgi:hypothetical protein